MYDFQDTKERKDFLSGISFDIGLKTKLSLENILLGVLLLSLLTSIPVYNYIQDEKIKRLQSIYDITRAKLGKKRAKTKEIEKIITKFKEKQKKLKENNELVGKRINLASIMKELEQVNTDRSWITNFEIRNHNNFVINGKAYNKLEINKLKKNLMQSNQFKNVLIESAKKDTKRLKNREVGIEKKQLLLTYKLKGKLNL